ncbi:hypothetical protein M406DRAFT_73636 [Cryphonectria parasitica EP155]|uniref:Uncharacterized protein n=1 Tax=Cryphonectria parasitica (strain ATCC 38755 / EP155) TaxID=660469 RepID=A0A9P4XUS4_CRYP1|nr:uncharacterized protein M406DRAFT_73636 [Cryphonectria parasitica EP155]KAF3761201.1 hypothetical protein M406DRAFT_73636 [Cryphonectria parasitica EP155]
MAASVLLPQAQGAWRSDQTMKNFRSVATMLATKCTFLPELNLPMIPINSMKSAGTDWILVSHLCWFVSQAVCSGIYYELAYRLVASDRGSLCCSIYSRALSLNITTLDESIAVTLMSTDMENLCQSAATLRNLGLPASVKLLYPAGLSSSAGLPWALPSLQ